MRSELRDAEDSIKRVLSVVGVGVNIEAVKVDIRVNTEEVQASVLEGPAIAADQRGGQFGEVKKGLVTKIPSAAGVEHAQVPLISQIIQGRQVSRLCSCLL